MVAVGSLKAVWPVEPEEFDGMTDLMDRFARYFRCRWEDAVVGGDRPFSEHRYWDAYLAVAGLAAPENTLLLPELLRSLSVRGEDVHQTIFG